MGAIELSIKVDSKGSNTYDLMSYQEVTQEKG